MIRNDTAISPNTWTLNFSKMKQNKLTIRDYHHYDKEFCRL